MRLFNRGDIPSVDWLDPLTMAVRGDGNEGRGERGETGEEEHRKRDS